MSSSSQMQKSVSRREDSTGAEEEEETQFTTRSTVIQSVLAILAIWNYSSIHNAVKKTNILYKLLLIKANSNSFFFNKYLWLREQSHTGLLWPSNPAGLKYTTERRSLWGVKSRTEKTPSGSMNGRCPGHTHFKHAVNTWLDMLHFHTVETTGVWAEWKGERLQQTGVMF